MPLSGVTGKPEASINGEGVLNEGTLERPKGDCGVMGHPPTSEVMERALECGGVTRRLAAETDAQCTAASYAPGPCKVKREPASGTVGSSHVNVILSSESSGRLNARRIASVNIVYPSGPGLTSKL